MTARRTGRGRGATLRRGLGIVSLAAAVVLAVAPGRADAAQLTKVGWWWKVNDGTVPVTAPAPPTVPSGGLYVAGAPDDALAIAALHFELGDGEADPVLTLAVAENGDQNGESAILAACVTGSAWEAAENGIWLYKPFPACDQGSVTGVRSDDGMTWTFALAPLLSDGIVDVTLVPGEDPTLPAEANGSTFQLAFDPPTAASLRTSSGTVAPPMSLPDFGSPDPGSGVPGFEAPGAGDGLSLAPVDPAAGFAPSLPDADQGMTATAPLVQRRNAPLPVDSVEDHTQLGVVLLALCGAALLWSAQLPVPGPRRLGTVALSDPAAHRPEAGLAPSADAVDGGLGRFARPREGAPPPL